MAGGGEILRREHHFNNDITWAALWHLCAREVALRRHSSHGFAARIALLATAACALSAFVEMAAWHRR